VKRGLVWPAVPDRNKHVHCRRIDPRVLDEDVNVAILVEDSGIDELVFPLMLPPGAIGFDKIRIRNLRLRIFVEHFQVGVGGGGIQVVIELLAIFSVIALRIGKAKETFFEDWITPVPESEGETEPLMVIAEAGESIFAPTVRTAARLVVGKISPRIAIRAIVLTHGAPLAFAEVRPPFAPEAILRFVALLLLNPKKFALTAKSGSVQGRMRWFVVHRGVLLNVYKNKEIASQTSTYQARLVEAT